MLKAIDLNKDARTPMPDVPSVDELTDFGITVDRHKAYEDLWSTLTYAGVVANTAVWLYM